MIQLEMTLISGYQLIYEHFLFACLLLGLLNAEDLLLLIGCLIGKLLFLLLLLELTTGVVSERTT